MSSPLYYMQGSPKSRKTELELFRLTKKLETLHSITLSSPSHKSSTLSTNISFEGRRPNKGFSMQNSLTPTRRSPSKKLLTSTSKSINNDPPPSTLSGMSSEAALRMYSDRLSRAEQKEILNYKTVYFLGLDAQKIVPNENLENYGYDLEGVYQAIPHDHVAYRYELYERIGKGTFSQVFSAFDHREQEVVALKIIKNRHKFFEDSLIEKEVLKTMKKMYPSASYFVEVRDHFVFRTHRVFAFKLLGMNLYQFIKENHCSGIPFKQAMMLSYQLLYAVSQLHHMRFIHCDLKPENILFTSSECNEIRLIDFGATCSEKHILSHYVQSRYYRSPEVLLGLPYNRAIDIWGFGCILIEMLTGKPPFLGENAQQQLLSIMEYLGYPPRRMLEQSPMSKHYFLTVYKVILKADSNKVTKRPSTKRLEDLVQARPGLVELLYACLEWDPAVRLTALQALSQSFYNKSNFNTPEKPQRVRRVKRPATSGH